MYVRMRMTLVCALVLSLVAVAGCAAVARNVDAGAGGPVKVGDAANRTEVTLAVGQTLEVSLTGNITTGYDWALDGALPSQVTTVSDQYVTDPGSAGATGAGGTHTFVFKAASPGTGTLKLKYWRSFEKGVAPSGTFTLTVTVK